MKGGWVGIFIMKIYLIGKSLYQDGIMQDSNANCSLAFAVYDDENNKVNANFIQTKSMTENLVGITDYGNMFFNSENTDLDSEISVEAIVDGKTVSYTLKTSDIMNGSVGGEIGRGGASSDLEPRVESLETSVSNLEPKVESLETSVSNLEPRVESLETSVSNLEPRVEENSNDIINMDRTLADVSHELYYLYEEVRSTPKNIYSVGEAVEIGVFYDGTTPHKLYRKVVDFGQLPNATSKTMAHGIPTGKVIVNICGVARSSNNNIPLPSVGTDSTGENNIYIGVGPNNITITTGKDRTNFTALVYIEYYIQQ